MYTYSSDVNSNKNKKYNPSHLQTHFDAPTSDAFKQKCDIRRNCYVLRNSSFCHTLYNAIQVLYFDIETLYIFASMFSKSSDDNSLYVGKGLKVT